MLLTNPQPVKAVVIVDEEYREVLARVVYHTTPEYVPWEWVYNHAQNILEGGDDPLESGFGIDIQQTIATNWESPDNLGLHGLLYLIDDVDPTGVGCDIMVLMTGQDDPNYDGVAWCLGRHFVMEPFAGMPMNLFQHEVTHLFGPLDHGWDWGIYCIMSYAYVWVTRGYCGPCTTNINQHRFRFD